MIVGYSNNYSPIMGDFRWRGAVSISNKVRVTGRYDIGVRGGRHIFIFLDFDSISNPDLYLGELRFH